jgi:hypothetical protein
MAREAEFIKDDWSALWWAIGTTRALLDRREALATSPAEVVENAQKFLEKQYAYGRTLMICSIWSFSYLVRLLGVHSLEQRIACGIAVCAGIFLAIVGWLAVRRVPEAPLDDDMGVQAAYCRSEMERIYGLFQSSFTVFAQAGYIGGGLFSLTRDPSAHPIKAGFNVLACAILMIAILVHRRRLHRQLDGLEALLSEGR